MRPLNTRFSVPKPLRGHAGTIQHDAIQSGAALGPRVEILLFLDEVGFADYCGAEPVFVDSEADTWNLDSEALERDAVIERQLDSGFETYPTFHPLDTLPPHLEPASPALPVAERVGRRSLSLPTWAGLTRKDLDRACGGCETLTGLPRR